MSEIEQAKLALCRVIKKGVSTIKEFSVAMNHVARSIEVDVKHMEEFRKNMEALTKTEEGK